MKASKALYLRKLSSDYPDLFGDIRYFDIAHIAVVFKCYV